ncbi:MAG: DUF3703 domain-containing protein [Kangiellaceae bacterium]|nr:DUF3703 domain-containing protein [Kangiellaceae bacterium]
MNIDQAFKHELQLAKQLLKNQQFEASFHHLERAHILSQPFYIKHLTSHYWMFIHGLKRLDGKEIFGQIIRMLGSIGSLFGKYPLGNTGGANVSPFKPMPIPEDLLQYF